LVSLEEFASKEIREYIKTDFQVFKPDDQISKVLGKLDSEKHYEVIVRDENKIGFITVRNMLNVVQPQQTKIDDYPGDRWSVFGVISPFYTVLDVTEILIKNKIRAIPVTENGKLKGFICQLDLLKGLAEVKELEGEPAKNIAVMPLITMRPDQNVSTARKLMLDKGFSHVPVIEKNMLVGMVTAKDIVTQFITPISATTDGDLIGEKVPRFTGKLKDIMVDNPPTVGPDASIMEAIQKMIIGETSAVIQISNNGVPIAIITPRELLSVVLRFRGQDEMPVYITGLSDIGNFLERAIIKEKIRRVIRKALKIHPHLDEVSIHIQASRREGNRNRYEITVNVISKLADKRFAFKREGWDVINIFDEISETLDRLLRESKHKPRGMSKTQKRIRFALRQKP
jgi:CBS domain-containing protein/ribosome-associated translation inhibitor RaiA